MTEIEPSAPLPDAVLAAVNKHWREQVEAERRIGDNWLARAEAAEADAESWHQQQLRVLAAWTEVRTEFDTALATLDKVRALVSGRPGYHVVSVKDIYRALGDATQDTDEGGA